MNDPHTPSDAAAIPDADEPATYRLVIRARIIAEDTPESAFPHPRHRALAMVGGGVIALVALIWIGISVLRPDSPSPLTRNDIASEVSAAPRQPAKDTTPVAASPAGASSTLPAQTPAPTNADPSPSPLQEVLPNVPRSALQTIRGTIRVTIRVTIDKQGVVVAATSRNPGPSRYFERLALESSREWTFTPAVTDEPRSMLVRFNFTRGGATASAMPSDD